MATAIKKVVRAQAETKEALFYQSYNDGTVTTRATGLYVNRGYARQNDEIINNNTDILQLIPFVAQGTADNQRLGDQITPVGLIVKGAVRVRYPSLHPATTAYQATNIKVCLFVLQHVSLKDYGNLYTSNKFDQLLENGEQATNRFYGNSTSIRQSIAKQYYRVLKRKVITLRYAGSDLVGTAGSLPGPTSMNSIANSHTWYADYTLNLSKSLPKTLKYPENSTPAVTVNEPTNSSIFMCMGYYRMDESPDLTDVATNSDIEQTYISHLTWKDM